VKVSRRVILLVTSPRLPAGVLTAQAWDLVRAHPVLAAQESELAAALRGAGASVEILEKPSAEAILAKAQPAVVWLSGPGGDEDLARELGLKLAREPGAAELELMYGSWDPPGARLLDAVAVSDRLRAEDPWRREQTHRTLARYLLEEAYEAYDSIIEGDLAALRGEMGDVLLQVLLHARLAEELPEGERWSIDDVAGDFVDKMIRRNPHVFSGVTVESTQEVVENWERIKREERPEGADHVTWSLPALVLAAKLLPKVTIPEGDDGLGAKLLRVIAEAGPGADAEAAVRQALRRYMDAS
jgi:NTP pyrophosphatase (non-canonical NTP hydrolase)